MMKVGLIVTATALLLLTAAASVCVWRANPAVGWRAFEQQFPSVLQQAGVCALGSVTEGSDQVALPLALRILQSFTPKPRVIAVTGFPESVQHFALESVQSHYRFDCLVRYSRGMVARVSIRYPSAAKGAAVKLGEGLRQLSDSIVVTLYENPGS